VHTDHAASGDRVQAWRFPAADAPRALQGPLGPSFHISVESQPIGLFAHQVMERTRGPEVRTPLRWRRVRGSRMVPAGEPVTAGFFVEWRREDGAWVISSFGDESFHGVARPWWCC
jgi:hypothetical protein